MHVDRNIVRLRPILHILQVEGERLEVDAEVDGFHFYSGAGAELGGGEVEDGIDAGVGEGVVDGLGGFGVDGDDADVDLVLANDRRELVPGEDFDSAAGT